jgi:pimeloyl-ACP methyl ester carboxylesterase
VPDVSFPGARAPDRRRTVVSHGVDIAVHEWGDAGAPPLVLAHGGFDFARTFDVFAPLLAEAGWRVVAWDQRGHGDSGHAALYAWNADVRDALAVIDSVTPGALPVVGHSKGGAVSLQFAAAMPHRVSVLVNLDGLPTHRAMPDVPDHELTRMRSDEIEGWLDFRRRAATKQRRADTLEGLAARRAVMNPRLSQEWLRYLVSVGARLDADGWRWKIDPALRMGGFGPWRPEWAIDRLASLSAPVLAVLGMQPERMGWGAASEETVGLLPPGSESVSYDDVGHFVHIEQPHRVAKVALAFLADRIGPPDTPSPFPPGPGGVVRGSPATTGDEMTSSIRGREQNGRPAAGAAVDGERDGPVLVRHSKVVLAVHRLRPDGEGRPLLHLHGLGERSPVEVPEHLAAWPGPVWALDFTGHGASTVPAGGGYFCEALMADVDAVLAEYGPVTLYGRGLGAYVALLAAGGRPQLVRGAVLDDGPGLLGGGPEPSSGFVLETPLPSGSAPDPYALFELGTDLRPPEYSVAFARQATALSGLEHPLAIAGRVRPPWLEAVAAEPGVITVPRATCTSPYTTVL